MLCQLVFTIELYCLVIRFGECNCCVCLLVSNHVPGVDHVSVQCKFRVRWMCAHVCSGSFRKEMVSEAVSCKALQWREEWVAFLHFSALECSAMLSCYQPAGRLDTIGSPTTSCLCRLPSSSVNLSFTAHFHSAHSFPMELSLYCKNSH